MTKEIEFQDKVGGVASPKGFFAAAASADVRKKGDDRLDTGVVYSPKPCTAAGVFTINAIKAAPVLQCQNVLTQGAPVHGIIANSGNANACTGEQGKQDATAMAHAGASVCGKDENSFFVCSTGRIGEPLPMEPLLKAIKQAGASALSEKRDNLDFGNSILTSDTREKVCTATFEVDGKLVTVGGSAKGAGMIQPNMATCLLYTSDAADE